MCVCLQSINLGIDTIKSQYKLIKISNCKNRNKTCGLSQTYSYDVDAYFCHIGAIQESFRLIIHLHQLKNVKCWHYIYSDSTDGCR